MAEGEGADLLATPQLRDAGFTHPTSELKIGHLRNPHVIHPQRQSFLPLRGAHDGFPKSHRSSKTPQLNLDAHLDFGYLWQNSYISSTNTVLNQKLRAGAQSLYRCSPPVAIPPHASYGIRNYYIRCAACVSSKTRLPQVLAGCHRVTCNGSGTRHKRTLIGIGAADDCRAYADQVAFLESIPNVR